MTTTMTRPDQAIEPTVEPVVVVKRRTIDSILISISVVAALVLAVAGGLLMWGKSFSDDYVHDELSSQHISFPSAEDLTAEGRADLAKYGGATVDTGEEAEAFAGYIAGHLEEIADGATYADLGGPEREAQTALEEATAAGQPAEAIAQLQADADAITEQRASLFEGETLRGLLLSAYAWSTVGTIAGISAIVAFIAAGLMAVLAIIGVLHHRRLPR
jgi:hypothetical protein